MSEAKPTRESLSKTPSWIMLGVVIGAIVALAVEENLENKERVRAAAAPKTVETKVETPAPPPKIDQYPSLQTVEALFLDWKDNAIWRHDITEIAVWDQATNTYPYFYEILRNGEEYYFRSLPKLTRPLMDIAGGYPAPIRFTETEEMRAERRSRLFPPPPVLPRLSPGSEAR